MCTEKEFSRQYTLSKASSVSSGVKLNWKKQTGVTGYLIYGIRPGGKYGYIGMTSGNTFTDRKASKKIIHFTGYSHIIKMQQVKRL